MEKKCMFCIIGGNSDDFGENTGKFFEVNMSNGVAYLPLVEIGADNATELKQKMYSTLDRFFRALMTEEREEKKMINLYGAIFFLGKVAAVVVALATIGLVALLVL